MKKIVPILLFIISSATVSYSQPVMETGGQKMPDEWIDKDTRHKVIRLSRKEGSNGSFYFHNNPFIGNEMVFYSTDKNGRQIHTVDLKTFATEQVTNRTSSMNGEIVGTKTANVYYQVKDSVFSTNIHSKETKLVFVFPSDFKASITTINADETLLAGAWSSDAEKEIFKNNPNKQITSIKFMKPGCRVIIYNQCINRRAK